MKKTLWNEPQKISPGDERCACVKKQSQAPGLPPTLENASSIPTFHTDSAGPISITELTSSVKTFVPEAEGTWCITITSQVKLWAPQHHQDIGSATAHPNLWERSRYDINLCF